MLEHGSAALFLDPGLGKTSITLSAIKVLKRRKVLSKVLLIAPLRVCHSVWPAEIDKWKNFHGLKCVVLHGPKKKERLAEEADIYIINPEGLDWLLDTIKTKTQSGKTSVFVDVNRFRKLGFDTLIIDELSKFKHSNTNRFKALKQVQGLFARRWGLTGSPASNGLMNLFGQCYILDGGNALGKFITHYRKTYFEPVNPDENGQSYTWALKAGAEDAIYERVSQLALRMGDDVIDMPELVERNIVVDIPTKAKKTYDKLEDELVAQLEDGRVSAANSAVAANKLRQMAGGGIYLDPEVEALVKLPPSQKEWVEIHKAKLDALEDLIDELQGSPLLVAYEYGHELSRLKQRFGADLPYIGGGVGTARSQELERAWNAGELPYLFGHPASIGHGLNLQQCGHHVAWFTPTWDYELYDQFNRRVYRQGNNNKRVFVHRFVAKDTIDNYVCVRLRRKEKDQNALFSALIDLRNDRSRY